MAFPHVKHETLNVQRRAGARHAVPLPLSPDLGHIAAAGLMRPPVELFFCYRVAYQRRELIATAIDKRPHIYFLVRKQTISQIPVCCQAEAAAKASLRIAYWDRLLEVPRSEIVLIPVCYTFSVPQMTKSNTGPGGPQKQARLILLIVILLFPILGAAMATAVKRPSQEEFPAAVLRGRPVFGLSMPSVFSRSR